MNFARTHDARGPLRRTRSSSSIRAPVIGLTWLGAGESVEVCSGLGPRSLLAVRAMLSPSVHGAGREDGKKRARAELRVHWRGHGTLDSRDLSPPFLAQPQIGR